MKVVFMGSPAFAVPALEAVHAHHEVCVVVTQPDKPAGRGRKLVAPAVKLAALELGLSVAQPTSARKPEFAAAMRETGADIAIVVAYGKILPKAALEAFPHGCLNIHGSLLPRYRGAAPIQRAIISGDLETGVTIMQLDEGMDTGPMLRVERMAIEPNDTVSSLAERMAPIGARALLATLEDIEAGRVQPEAQDDSLATHAAMLAKSDGAIDWSLDARLVSAHMRGVDPWPGAYSELAGERLKLFSPTITEGAGEPGTLIAVDKRGIEIACGQGAVIVADVQAPGKKRMAAADFARGRRLQPGPRLVTP